LWLGTIRPNFNILATYFSISSFYWGAYLYGLQFIGIVSGSSGIAWSKLLWGGNSLGAWNRSVKSLVTSCTAGWIPFSIYCSCMAFDSVTCERTTNGHTSFPLCSFNICSPEISYTCATCLCTGPCRVICYPWCRNPILLFTQSHYIGLWFSNQSMPKIMS
jgi:hypothetical protein